MFRKSARILPVVIALLAVLTLSISTSSARTVLMPMQSAPVPGSNSGLNTDSPETLGTSSDGDPDTLGGAQQAIPEIAAPTNNASRAAENPSVWGKLFKVLSKYALGLPTGR